MAISQQSADKLSKTGWHVFDFSMAVLVFSAWPITGLVMLTVALGTALSGQKGRDKIKALGINPINWVFDDDYRWVVLLPFVFEVAVGIAFLCGAYMPNLLNFYVLMFPATSMMAWIGLGLLGAALLIGLAYWILKPSEPRYNLYLNIGQGVNNDYRPYPSNGPAPAPRPEWKPFQGTGHTLGESDTKIDMPSSSASLLSPTATRVPVQSSVSSERKSIVASTPVSVSSEQQTIRRQRQEAAALARLNRSSGQGGASTSSVPTSWRASTS